MTTPGRASDAPAAHPYLEEIEAERAGWYELSGLVRSLTPTECLEPGYYRDPDWTVRDLVAHVGTWLAEAHRQFECLRAGTYDGHDVDIDAVNAALLRGMEGQPWEVAWVQAPAARSTRSCGKSALGAGDGSARSDDRKGRPPPPVRTGRPGERGRLPRAACRRPRTS